METILSFVALSLLIIAGAFAVNRAKRYLDGSDVRRESLESLTELANFDGLTSDERKVVATLVEFRMQRL